MTIGVIGAGQLGRMMALAGYPLGENFLFLDPSAEAPAAQLAPALIGPMDDAGLLAELARRCSVLTFDWENASVVALRAAARGRRVYPPLRALAACQDRLAEKRTFERLGIPTTRYQAVTSINTLRRACQRIGLPGVLKTRRMGYDGKGQYVIRTSADIAAAWQALGQVPDPQLLFEEFIPFDYEVSIIGARGRDGSTALYPLNRNFHVDGILRLTLAPWDEPRLLAAASRHLCRVMEDFRYVGTLAIEFFVRNGRLVANEMAPRVHNSGHWTIEGCVTSQFENHVRAITGLPLGDTASRGHCAMINLIGSMPRRQALLAERAVHWHDYGKIARPGRKLGHLTLVAPSVRESTRRARRILARIYPQIGGRLRWS